jgi:hypothetical protein
MFNVLGASGDLRRENQGRTTDTGPPASEYSQMIHRATMVAQMLDALRVARHQEEMNDPIISPSGSKRSWDTAQDDLGHIRSANQSSTVRNLRFIFKPATADQLTFHRLVFIGT